MKENQKTMSNNNKRREFIRQMGIISAIAGVGGGMSFAMQGCGPKNAEKKDGSTADSLKTAVTTGGDLFFKISLAEWSLHRALKSGKMSNMDFPGVTKNDYGIDAVEYVNQFFMDKAKDKTYLTELKTRCDDLGVTSVRIMIDSEGDLGNTNEKERIKAIENHYKWVEAAQFLGCTDIRVNARGEGTEEEVAKAATDGLGRLTQFAKDYNIAIIVENHGGYSSNGQWMSGVMDAVGDPDCGMLPDFGNFCIEREEPKEETIEAHLAAKCLNEYDKYKGTQELMPYAKGVSAKSYDFDEAGNETTIDYMRIMKIVKEAGYIDYVGIEYEGIRLSEEEGIRKTLALLKKVGAKLG